jgi:predicted Zn-dependent protease with MMP-like domain
MLALLSLFALGISLAASDRLPTDIADPIAICVADRMLGLFSGLRLSLRKNAACSGKKNSDSNNCHLLFKHIHS